MPDSFRGWGPLLYGPPVTRHVHVADICQLLDHQIGRSHGRRTFRSNGSETASASRPRWRCPPRRPPHRTSLRQLRAEAMRYQGYASDKLSALFRPARATTSLKPTESSQGPAVLVGALLERPQRLPEFYLVSLQIVDPCETAVVVVFAFWIDPDTFGRELREESVEIGDAKVDHEGRRARVEVLRAGRERRPYRHS